MLFWSCIPLHPLPGCLEALIDPHLYINRVPVINGFLCHRKVFFEGDPIITSLLSHLTFHISQARRIKIAVLFLVVLRCRAVYILYLASKVDLQNLVYVLVKQKFKKMRSDSKSKLLR